MIENKIENWLSLKDKNYKFDENTYKYWLNNFYSFKSKIEHAKFRGIVFDYDGTLCDVNDGYNPPNIKLVKEIIFLLAHGIVIGIATGRGRTIYNFFRDVIPKQFWNNFVIGNYNGDKIYVLNSDFDSINIKNNDILKEIVHRLNNICKNNIKTKLRGNNLSIQFLGGNNYKFSDLIETVDRILKNQVEQHILKRVISNNCIDIILSSVSKANVVLFIKEKYLFNENDEILAIGDQGNEEGNDFELLSTNFGLSVNKVSKSPNSCWNLAGSKKEIGPKVTLDYLQKLIVKENYCKMLLFRRTDNHTKAVVNCIITNPERSLFLIQRKDGEYFFPEFRNCVSFFGGTVEKNETSLEAVKREIIEEINLDTLINEIMSNITFVFNYTTVFNHVSYVYESIISDFKRYETYLNHKTDICTEGKMELIEKECLFSENFSWDMKSIFKNYIQNFEKYEAML